MTTRVTWSDNEWKSHVQKDASARLNFEISRAQNVLSEDEIAALSRTQLVSYIVHLRRLAGQTGSIQALVADFDKSQVVFFPEPEEGKVGAAPRTPTAVTNPTDPTIMFLQYLAMQEKKLAEDKA